MRLLFLLIPFFFFQSINTKAQNTFEYTSVIQLEGTTKNNLYQRAIEWVNENFKSSKAVIQNSDKEAGSILCKGAMKLQLPAEDWVYFSFNILVKDGKYKYIFKDFSHEGSTEGGERNGGSLQSEKPACGGFRMTTRYWEKIKTATDKEISALIVSLNNKMKQKSEVEDF